MIRSVSCESPFAPDPTVNGRITGTGTTPVVSSSELCLS
jgi:hypothetical protein